MKIITVNVNGIRASAKKGLFEWLASEDPDVVCLQETKAQVHQLTDDCFFPEQYHCVYNDALKKGYSGVAIYSKAVPQKVTREMGWQIADDEGRYLQFDYPNLSVISLYLPSGSSKEERQVIKMDFLEQFSSHLQAMLASGREWILCGDFNIAHTKDDIKNWRGNQKNSGFLPEERAWLDYVFDDLGFVDAFRALNKDSSQYTWWSNRGRAWDNNVGWRIDYQVVTPNLANKLIKAEIYKEQRFSDHAPLTIEYAL